MSTHPRRVTVCRKISFSCGHRYFNPGWTAEKNAEVYGSDYTTAGYGHNFILEAFLEGLVDPVTGMVVNLKEVDAWLRAVTEPLDHHFLNNDVAWFQERVPTAENVAVYCFDRLAEQLEKADRPDLRLMKIRLYEGRDFWVDCGGEGESCE
jgi:6-pyruvoyltetrahydropterin/6-carboxytetrahydropterin synthase